MEFCYTNMFDANIFSQRDFGSCMDQQKAKRLGQWITRLYVTLFVIVLIVLGVQKTIQSRTITKTFDKPSYQTYQRLFQRYSDELKCPCLSLTSTYGRYVQMETVFHQVQRILARFMISDP